MPKLPPLNLHASAEANYNERAAALAARLTQTPTRRESAAGFPSDIVVTDITEDQIIGELEKSVVDYTGKTVGRYFLSGDSEVALEGDAYRALSSLAEAVQSNTAFRTSLSRAFVADALFAWLKATYGKEAPSQPFINFLIARAEESVRDLTIWTPIANLEVETPFPLAGAEIRPLSQATIDQWERTLRERAPHNEGLPLLFADFRRRFQGLAAVVTTVRAEPQRATEYASEQAEDATSLLAFFSGALLLPEVKCLTRPKGSENSETRTTLVHSDSADIFTVSSKVLDLASAQISRLAASEIEHMRMKLLDKLSALLTKSDPSAFEQAAATSVLLYTKAAFTASPVDKLVYILTSLESMFLKNDNEPIQQNLAERLAMLTTKGLEPRKKVLGAVKAVYAIRSKYLHHGHASSDLAAITEFLRIAWGAVWAVVANTERFKNKAAFIEAIDDRKLAGG